MSTLNISRLDRSKWEGCEGVQGRDRFLLSLLCGTFAGEFTMAPCAWNKLSAGPLPDE